MNNKNKAFGLIYLLGFLVALSTALPSYIQSSFLGQYLNLNQLSIYLTVITALNLVVIFFYPGLIKKIGNLRSWLLASLVTLLGLLILGLIPIKTVILIIFAIQYIGLILIFINNDIILESISDDQHTGRIRGRYLTIQNIGWLISPLIMGWIMRNNNYQLIYLLSALILFACLIIFYNQKKQFNDRINYQARSFSNLFHSLKNNPNLRKIFSVNFALRLFYFLMVIYTPLYLNQNIGFSWPTIGFIFTIMLLPFILIGIPAGILADRYLGEKELITTGLIIMFLSVLMIFFTASTSPLVWALILFISRIGAALVETMRESYFFKQINSQDSDIINLFRNIQPLSCLIGSILSLIIFKFFPIQYIFMFLAIVLLISLWPAITLKDTR